MQTHLLLRRTTKSSISTYLTRLRSLWTDDPHSEPENRLMYLAGTTDGKNRFPSVRFLVRSIAESTIAAVSKMIAKRVAMSASLKPCLDKAEAGVHCPGEDCEKDDRWATGEPDSTSPAAQTATMTR